MPFLTIIIIFHQKPANQFQKHQTSEKQQKHNKSPKNLMKATKIRNLLKRPPQLHHPLPQKRSHQRVLHHFAQLLLRQPVQQLAPVQPLPHKPLAAAGHLRRLELSPVRHVFRAPLRHVAAAQLQQREGLRAVGESDVFLLREVLFGRLLFGVGKALFFFSRLFLLRRVESLGAWGVAVSFLRFRFY